MKKSWKQVAEIYPAYLERQNNTPRRLSSMHSITDYIRQHHPDLYDGTKSLHSIDKERLQRMYKEFKGAELSSAEKTVFNEFYKLS
jgi:hypothetical protein